MKESGAGGLHGPAAPHLPRPRRLLRGAAAISTVISVFIISSIVSGSNITSIIIISIITSSMSIIHYY